jgi:hypothetical protein
MILWINKNDLSEPTCAALGNSQHRKNLRKIIETIQYLATQGLEFSRHDETSSSDNRGNFLELIELMSIYDDDLSNHIIDKIANYTGVDSQNVIISFLAGYVKNKKLPKSGEFFSLIAEETLDLSKTEQVCVWLRYVHHDFRFEERLFGFFPMNVSTADAIFEIIKSCLNNLELDLNLIVGQSYDGVAAMSGIKNGVATKF